MEVMSGSMGLQLPIDPVDVLVEAWVADAQGRALVQEIVPRGYWNYIKQDIINYLVSKHVPSSINIGRTKYIVLYNIFLQLTLPKMFKYITCYWFKYAIFYKKRPQKDSIIHMWLISQIWLFFWGFTSDINLIL